ncbi:MAG: serine--tRNA ligase [Parasphingorhabdus sp.]
MHDIKLIRENPEAFDVALARRGVEPVAAEIIALDETRRSLATELQQGQARRNEASKAIGKAKGQGDEETAQALMSEVSELKTSLPALEEKERDVGVKLRDMLASIPNLPADDVPDGADEDGNVEISTWGEPGKFDFEPKEHADFAPALGMDFESGTRISGARFTFLRGGMARLHRALGQYMLDQQTQERGYVECNPPVLVNDDAMYGTDKLPKFSEDSFRTTDDRWLIPTAEVSLTSSVMGEILEEADLPVRLTALTLCFRSEAGSAGRDTRGFIRQHQFEKCELVSIVRPEDSEAEHQRMTDAAESILQLLELPYRKIELCTGDIGFGARKTFDLEVWLPGQNAYREISSCSNTGDFQARRMNTRFRPDGEIKGTRFVHTLNGSGLAVGRTLVAILENYQQADGSVEIPTVLRSYMGGIEKLEPA